MYFAYFDESGDQGYDRSPSSAFTLAGVIIHENDWMNTLDDLVVFRRYLRDNFGIPPRVELKANWLVHRKGPFFKYSKLSYEARMNVYRAALRFQRKSGAIRTFAVVINKNLIKKKEKDAPRIHAWKFAIQRLERFGTAQEENMHVIPDEGHGYFIRNKLREMRRFSKVRKAYGGGVFDREARNVIEDSSDRRSHESYFVQLADLNAYAAYRYIHPGRNFTGSVWDNLGDSRILKVNEVTGGPPGIVAWPRLGR